jgi:hypothetical protein
MAESKLTDGQLTVLVAQKIVARCIEVAGATDAGSVVLSAALFGATVRMEFEAEMQRRFGPGGTGGIVFSDEVTDIMIAGGKPDIWTDLSKGFEATVDPRLIAEKRATAGILSPFPVVRMKGISFDYNSWIAPRFEQLLPEFKTLTDRLGKPVQMFPSLMLATRSLFSVVKSPTQAELAVLALDVMLGVAKLPVGAKLQLVPNAQPPMVRSRPTAPQLPPQSSQPGWRSIFGRRA